MISRNWFIFRSILVVVFTIIFLLSVLLFKPTSVGRWVAALIWFAMLIIHNLCSRCPHCRHPGLRFRWSSGDAGYCNYCGKLVEWKEYQD